MTIAEQEKAKIPKIKIIDSNTKENIYIKQKEYNCHHKTLGVYINMIGDDDYQCAV